MRLVVLTLALTGLLGACSQPDCSAICKKSLACDVTFTPNDDPYLEKIDRGERSAQQSCEIGCEQSLSVDSATEDCVTSITSVRVEQCRQQVLDCLGQAQGGAQAL